MNANAHAGTDIWATEADGPEGLDGGVELAVSTVIFALRPHPESGLMTLWLPLVKRIREPYLGQWALPGGPLRPDEDLETSARRTLLRTTSVEPRYLEQLYAFGSVERSGTDAPRTSGPAQPSSPPPQPETAEAARVVSIVYWVLVQSDEAARAVDGENVQWFIADDLPPLAFDHDEIIAYALWRLRNKLEYAQIAQGFLGGEFTMAQLREVYEAVLQRRLDPANFRRQMITSKAVEPTGRKVTGTSHRPPVLYRFRTRIGAAAPEHVPRVRSRSAAAPPPGAAPAEARSRPAHDPHRGPGPDGPYHDPGTAGPAASGITPDLGTRTRPHTEGPVRR